VLRGPICPPISPKWKIISAKTAQNLPKLRESCALWQKLRGCAPQNRNFLVGLNSSRVIMLTNKQKQTNSHVELLKAIGPTLCYAACRVVISN